jgi:hypothetical protein
MGWFVVDADYSKGAPGNAWGAGVISGGNQRAVETVFMQVDAAARAAAPRSPGVIICCAHGQGLLNCLNAMRYETGITNVKGIYAASGFFDLLDAFNGPDGSQVITAYNISGGNYSTQTSGRDPQLATAAQLAGVAGFNRLRFAFSCGDEISKPNVHAVEFNTKFAGLTGVIEHSSFAAQDNGSHLFGRTIDPADFIAFGARAVAGTDTTVPSAPMSPNIVDVQDVFADISQPLGNPPSNLAGWNVYLSSNGGTSFTKLNGSLLTADLLGSGGTFGSDGVSSSNATYTSNSVPFAQAMVGQTLFGDKVPLGTRITGSVTGGFALSLNTTGTASGLTFVVPNLKFRISNLSASTTYLVATTWVSIDGVESAQSVPLVLRTQDSPLLLTTGVISSSWNSGTLPTALPFTTIDSLTLTIPAASYQRTAFVHYGATVSKTSQSNGQGATPNVFLDGTNQYSAAQANYYNSDGNQYQSINGAPLTIPGDNATHTVAIEIAAQGATTAVSFANRWLSLVVV